MATVVLNRNLLGDALMVTPAVEAYKKIDPDITMIVGPEEFNDILLKSPCAKTVIKGTPEQIHALETKYARARGKLELFNVGGKPTSVIIPDINMAFRYVQSKTKGIPWPNQTSPHLSEGIAQQFGVQLTTKHYSVQLDEEDWLEAGKLYAQFTKPLLVCAAVSTSCTSRDKCIKNLPANKMLSAEIWRSVIDALKHSYDFAFVCGKGEERLNTGGVWLEGKPIRHIAGLCKFAHAVVTIDTGIMHVAQAVDANIVAICAAVLSSSTSCSDTRGHYICVDHTNCSPTPGSIQTVTADEIIDAITSIAQ